MSTERIYQLSLLMLMLVILSSCASNKDGFQQFYNDHKNDSSLALSIPKWATMPFIDKEDRATVKKLSQGMKTIRFIYDDDGAINNSFNEFITDKNYQNFLYLRDDGNEINLFTHSKEGYIREIVLSVGSNDESAVIAILGKVKETEFKEKISPYLKETL